MVGRILVWIILASLAVLVIGFTMLNKGTMEIHYGAENPFVWPTAVVVAVSACVGIALGFIVCFFKVLQLKRQIAIMRRVEAREKKKTISSQLRTIPLEGSQV